MRSHRYARHLSAVIGLWVAFLWGGPAALQFCPMHTAGDAHAAHRSAAVAQAANAAPEKTPAPKSTQQPCTCLWCVVGGSAVLGRTPELAVRSHATIIAISHRPPVDRLPSTSWYRLPFAIGPPRV